MAVRFARLVPYLITLLVGASWPAAEARADSKWDEYSRAARAALATKDDSTATTWFERRDELVGGHPGSLYNLAVLAVRRGDHSKALARLAEYAAMGLTRDVRADSLLAPLRDHARFRAIETRMDSNGTPVANAVRIATLGDPALLAEDIAWDGSHREFLVSSIHAGKIVAVNRGGHARDLIVQQPDSAWGIFALRVDEKRQILWATTAAMKTVENYQPADSGRTAVLCFDLGSLKLIRRVELPRDGGKHVLGDMTLSPDGTAYITESLGGGLYALRPERAELDTLAPSGTFGSPQTPVLTPDGRRLLIPDYPRGIATFDLASRAVAWMPKPRTLAATGIDGLYRVGSRLIAVQNGTTPHRVLWLNVDAACTHITGWKVLESASPLLGEPSHGIILGPNFIFLGNTGWDRVNDAEQLVTGPTATPPVILRLRIPKER